jgi:hypothetical protein
MIKAVLLVGSKKIVLLGLTGENMARLMNKEPIVINLKELGLPDQDLAIVGGKDEDAIQDFILSEIAAAMQQSAEGKA